MHEKVSHKTDRAKCYPVPGIFKIEHSQQLDAAIAVAVVVVVDADDLSPGFLLAWYVLSAIWSIARHHSSQPLPQQ